MLNYLVAVADRRHNLLAAELRAPDSSPPYDSTDVRFLGVIFSTRDVFAVDTYYTFYGDSGTVQDAP